MRNRMPPERFGRTHKFVIKSEDGEHEGYITANTYPGTNHVGEIFIRMGKEGSEKSGIYDQWAIAVSWLLQLGIPLHAIVDKFKATKFQPSGFTETDGIRIATSIPDYICRWLEQRYLGEEDAAPTRSAGSNNQQVSDPGSDHSDGEEFVGSPEQDPGSSTEVACAS